MVSKDNAFNGSVVKGSKPKDYSPFLGGNFCTVFGEINNNFSGNFCKTFHFFFFILVR